MLAKKKKLRKNKYKTPEQKQKKKLKGNSIFAAIFSVIGAFTCIAMLSAILIVSYSWITQTDLLETEYIEISGINRLSEGDILKQGRVKYGMNIFEINLSVLNQSLLAHPWIKKVELFRIMPNRIQINVQEHLPLAIVEFDERYLMNHDGIIFNKYSEPFNELPIISGLLPDDINIFSDDEFKNDTSQLSAVMEILKIQSKTFRKISEKKVHTIRVDHELGLTLLSDGQIKEVKLGFDDYQDKLNKLEDVVKFITKNDDLLIIEKIDIVNTDRIVIKPANETNTHNLSKKGSGGDHAST